MTAEAAGPLMTDARRNTALATVCAVLFLTFLDTTIVSVVLAGIQQDLHAGVTTLQWIVNGYALVFASLMLAGGTLGDLFGRKRVMLLGVAVFCGGSVLAALAPDPGTLIAGRVVMGLGAAASEPGTLSIIRHLYPEERSRARALGAWAAVSGLALAMGPVAGGLLAGVGGWRSVFWFNLAFGAAALVLAAVVLPESSDRKGRRVDLPGIVLGGGALAAVVYAVTAGETTGYTRWWILLLFGVALVAAVAFVLVERRAPDPVLDLAFFRRPAYTGAIVVAFVTFFGVFAIFFFVALYLQVIVGQSADRTAGNFAPMMVVMIAASALTGGWVARAGPRIPMTVGCALGAAGLFATGEVLGPSVGFAPLTTWLAVAGAGFGIALVPVTTAALGAVPAERSGMAASTTNTSRALGAVFGVAVLGTIVNSRLTSHLEDRLNELGIPANFQSIVISAVTHGGVPSNGQQVSNPAAQGQGSIVDEVIHAAYDAFYAGLHVALILAGALLTAGAAVSFVTMRPARPAGGPPDGSRRGASTTIRTP
jgi:EmrB/QacA subfamily drug resistance transporter